MQRQIATGYVCAIEIYRKNLMGWGVGWAHAGVCAHVGTCACAHAGMPALAWGRALARLGPLARLLARAYPYLHPSLHLHPPATAYLHLRRTCTCAAHAAHSAHSAHHTHPQPTYAMTPIREFAEQYPE